MAHIHELKEREILDTPLLVFECAFANGDVERWSTHQVSLGSDLYEARILRHNIFEITAPFQDGVESSGKLSLTLANADSYFSQLERSMGFRGARLKVSFLFFDLAAGAATCDPIVLFAGRGDAPEEIGASEFKVSFHNRLNLQRQQLPSQRIQSRCPWLFPSSLEQREEAAEGGASGAYSPFYSCGYSPDQPGGRGNLDGAEPFTSCRYTRADCLARGMFREDAQSRATARFGGFEFIPASILVRSHGERGSHLSEALDNRAQHDDAVPLIYGTGWIEPPVIFARNDGNLTHFEVLIGTGPMEGVLKVVVNGWELPLGEDGRDMSSTGWYKVVSLGGRNGQFNPDFSNGSGGPEGDPHGGTAVISVVVPTNIADGKSAPKLQALVRGLKLPRFGTDGAHLDCTYSNNPAWVLLDLLRRSGWTLAEIDLGSFGRAASECEELIQVVDNCGRTLSVPRFGSNLVLRGRRSVAELIRGVRNSAGLYLDFTTQGQLRLSAERSLAGQQATKPSGSNATQPLAGGWPAYEFGDGTEGRGSILRDASGRPSIRLWSRASAETSNRVSVEFQNEFNEYQQDSVSIVAVEDVLRSGRELAVRLQALGLPNANQAARLAGFHLQKVIEGHLQVSFETSVRGVMLRPGDLITLTYLKEGLDRRVFRITRIAPGMNFESVRVIAQQHEDAWYEGLTSGTEDGSGNRRQTDARMRVPRPLAGRVLNDTGGLDFEVVERAFATGEEQQLELTVGFTRPRTAGKTQLGVPVVGLTPTIEDSGGSLPGGQSLYYAVTALDSDGQETAPSFVVRATIPGGTTTNQVTIEDLGFSPGTTGFRVYRGHSPAHLLQIGSLDGVAAAFTDPGLEALSQTPPDGSYDHANFYWRWETVPEAQATIFSEATIGNGGLGLQPNEMLSRIVRIVKGKGSGQEATIASNTATTITLAGRWVVAPDSSSMFVVADSTWHFAGTSSTDSIAFLVPNRGGMTVHLSGRAANASDNETTDSLSPLTRYQLEGGSGSGTDQDAPGPPLFALNPTSNGTIELTAVGFSDLKNTRSITSGTLTLHYWDEMAGPSLHRLASDLTEQSSFLQLTSAGPAQLNDMVQLGAEILRVEDITENGTVYQVSRGQADSPVEAHLADKPVYHLSRKVMVLPFSRGFFGSPASGSYAFPITLGDSRVAAAELFVTNSRGDSPTTRLSVTRTTDSGLRVLSGGQFSLQVEGEPAVQANAAPPLVVEQSYAVRDVFATMREGPSGAPVQIRLRVDDETYCELTVPSGSTASEVVSGFDRKPLPARSVLALEIVAVGREPGQTPGRDLTVTMRL